VRDADGISREVLVCEGDMIPVPPAYQAALLHSAVTADRYV
jgi:hypothetical protein